jgi:hypothetical protein
MAHAYDRALDAVLAPLVDDLREALGEELVGLYLYGSAVSGGFDEGVSDLDLVAVTGAAVAELDLGRLGRVHKRFVERDPSWHDRLEIVYVARNTVAGSIGQQSVAVISPGEPFHVTGPASDWLQNWYLVRETGVTLVGSPATDVIGPLSLADYLAAVRAYLSYLAGSEPSAFAVLSACRALRTQQTAARCSKQEGAAWVKERLPEWTWLVDLALEERLTRSHHAFRTDPTRTAARRFVQQLAMAAG